MDEHDQHGSRPSCPGGKLLGVRKGKKKIQLLMVHLPTDELLHGFLIPNCTYEACEDTTARFWSKRTTSSAKLTVVPTCHNLYLNTGAGTGSRSCSKTAGVSHGTEEDPQEDRRKLHKKRGSPVAF